MSKAELNGTGEERVLQLDEAQVVGPCSYGCRITQKLILSKHPTFTADTG